MDPRTPTGPDGLPQAASPATAHSRIGVSGSAAITQKKEENGNARQEESRGQDQGQAGTRQGAQARHRRRTQERLRALIAPWWERDPAVARREIRALRRAGFHPAKRIGPGSTLTLTFAHGGHPYQLHFEDNYLEGGAVNALRLTPEGGRIERAGRAFRLGSSHGALDAVAEAARAGTPSMKSDQRVVLPVLWSAPSVGAFGSLRLGGALYGTAIAGLGVAGLDRSEEFSQAGAEFARAFPLPISGLWSRVNSFTTRTDSAEMEVATVEERIASAHGLSVTTVRKRLRTEIGALIEGRDGSYPDWRFVRRSRFGSPIVLQTVWYGQPFRERAPYAMVLQSKRVAIIGCGAVGWAVATLLARSGLRRFVLYDDDEIGAGNLARLGAWLGQVGTTKVNSLAEGLHAIAPGIEARALPFEVGSSVGAGALVGDEPDLLINVTGEERSTLETNRAALILGTPAIFAWVSNGVWAGRILRVRPFEAACYECVRDSEPAPLRSFGPVPVDGRRPWSGSVIDVKAFAAAVAQAAVRTLLGEPVSESNPDHFVLDFRALTPAAKPIRTRRDQTCIECGSGRGVQ